MKLLLTLCLTLGLSDAKRPRKPAPKKTLSECVCRCVYDAERDLLWCVITCQ